MVIEVMFSRKQTLCCQGNIGNFFKETEVMWPRKQGNRGYVVMETEVILSRKQR